MKIIIHQNQFNLIRFDKGEEVIKGLQQYCQENSFFAGSFHALGAAGEVVLSYYNLGAKKYEDTTISEAVEIASMVGNIATMPARNATHSVVGGNDEIVIHSHGVFGKKDLSTVGGHIKSLTVSATCEVSLTVLSGKMTRAYDIETGLNLLK